MYAAMWRKYCCCTCSILLRCQAIFCMVWQKNVCWNILVLWRWKQVLEENEISLLWFYVVKHFHCSYTRNSVKPGLAVPSWGTYLFLCCKLNFVIFVFKVNTPSSNKKCWIWKCDGSNFCTWYLKPKSCHKREVIKWNKI